MSRVNLAGFDFYADLEEDNSKAFWQARQPDYDRHVLRPLRLVLAELAEEFGEAKVFRPHRDVRFSADKSPYKTHQGAYVAAGPAVGWYVEISADGLRTGGGFYAADAAHLANYRKAVAEDGSTLAGLLAALPTHWGRGGDKVRTAPRGYPKEHPQIDLLRHKSLSMMRTHGRAVDLSTEEAAAMVRADWRQVSEVVEWLAEAIGQ